MTTWFSLWQEEQKTLMHTSELPSFRYGLNIFIKPKHFSLETLSFTDCVMQVEHTDGVHILEDEEAFEDEERIGPFLGIPTEKHALAYFNYAHLNKVLYIEITQSSQEPLIIKQRGGIAGIFVLVHPQVSAKIVFEKTGKEYTSSLFRVIAQEGSHVEVVGLQHTDGSALNVDEYIAVHDVDSTVNWTTAHIGGVYAKADIINQLAEAGASSKNTAVYAATGEQKLDLYTAGLHQAERTSADIVTKGAIGGQAKALSRGLIRIESNAFGSEGYEQQDALLLSDKAEADAIPNLEIENHDVTCSHGSTVGTVNEEQVFYLMSRGLTKNEAISLIVEGYFAPIIDQLSDDNQKEDILALVRTSLEGLV